MCVIKDFFENRGFSFGLDKSDIKSKTINISENIEVSGKLADNIFVYDSPKQTNTSFYIISVPLTDKELFEVRRYIWNENKYDLYFTFDKKDNTFQITLFYARTNPKNKKDTIRIESFNGDEKDIEKLKKISKWQFEAGLFWLSYSDFLEKVKKSKEVDKSLIDNLKQLKNELQIEYSKHNISNISEIVQALIDRTLFIKFLEDNLIINSSFYKHYLSDSNITYKNLLLDHDKENINKLFNTINEIFNNFLFRTPIIKNNDLKNEILDLLHDAISQKDWRTGQLSLFDFRFDIIPIEFISHIYEVFLEKKQSKEGIFYTPKKLTQLIVDDTITKKGTVLDPSCGSGMFLVLAFRKLLEFEPVNSDDVVEIIEHKNKLLEECIFGIEKEPTARRMAVFSLYLELLRGINAESIKEFIKNKLKDNKSQQIFPYDFTENILCANSLETKQEKIPHKNRTFDFIVGNPPFLGIDKESEIEQNFIDKYKIIIDDKTLKTTDVVGYKQISQCFMLKIKDWSKLDTHFGFVLNSSNFYNEKSIKFQKFFFRYYQIDKFYELSNVKNILFLKSRESIDVIIFNNQQNNNNTIEYFPVELGTFSEIFNLLIIQEDKKIDIKQQDIFDEKIKLRDYLIGNEYDRNLIEKLKGNFYFKDFILNDIYYGLTRGMEITGKDVVCKKYNIETNTYNQYSNEKRKQLLIKYKTSHSEKKQNKNYNIPYIELKHLDTFKIKSTDCYLQQTDIENKIFRRNKKIDFFKGKRILYSQIPKSINFVYSFFAHFVEKETICVSSEIFSIRLNKEKYYFTTAVLNSLLANYYLNIAEIRRPKSSFPKVNMSNINKIPLPSNLNSTMVNKIEIISQQLTEGKIKYEGKVADELNDLIFDLYDLDILEKTRITNFFKAKRKVTKTDLKEYKKSLINSLEIYFNNKPIIESYIGENLPFGLVIIAIYFDNKKQPTGKKTLQYIINEILLQNPHEKFLAMQEKIFGNNCIYIVKDNQYHSWTTTKAFEDGQYIIKKLVS
ncbi:MAG: hypothetical protein KAV44_04845 [Bacteroidales bacterium]|jgi:type I restriction-modification system DNA methylase subunit|nr:hypothetical protein [Bacteroidales bacterium]